jgi:hypothetical protein
MPDLAGSLTKLFTSGKKLSRRKSYLEQTGVESESHFHKFMPAVYFFNVYFYLGIFQKPPFK